MATKALALASTALSLAMLALPAAAEDMTAGAREYANSCAACHGTDGKGEGVLSGHLNARVPDLTQLQANNDGVFPVSYAYEVIENSFEVGAHGTTDMPAWGQRYKYDANRRLGEFASLEDTEEFVKFRILALIEHLSTMQEQ